MGFRRISTLMACAGALAAITGCATVPSDPYHDDYSTGPVYDNAPVHGGAYPAYPAPAYGSAYPVYPAPAYGGSIGYRDRDQDRWENMRNDRDRRAWRERQVDRERAHDRAERDRNAQRDRTAQDRQRDRAQRERDERARRDADRQRTDSRQNDLGRAEQDRAYQQSRNPDGTPRTDYERYNPSNGRWKPREADMP